MTTGQKIYTALTILCAIVALFVAGFLYLMTPDTKPDTVPLYKWMTFNFGLISCVLFTTSLINLIKNELLLISTIVQCGFMLITGYAAPLAIFGIILLVRKHKKGKQEIQTPNPASE
ncbi:MAG: hypothetical protein JW860_14850 [Sedimentisphaerales bacterium]|nr:hypothetical protein [Sedimentisphaerales bacterium]